MSPPGLPTGSTTTSLSQAVQRGLAYLLRGQHPAGSFTDFWLPVGTSDAWVTAYTGLALHAVATCSWLNADQRARAEVAARLAAGWLSGPGLQRRGGGWGYNLAVPADADSTAHVLSLLARLQLPVPDQGVTFLRSHAVEGGFATYAWSGQPHAWTRPCPDVTAAALRALHDLGELTTAQLRTAWNTKVSTQQGPDGLWAGYWWLSSAYPTGLALEVWAAAGRPPLQAPECLFPAPQGAFDLAWQLRAQLALTRTAAPEMVAQLIAQQEVDGGWPARTILTVPPAHPTRSGTTLLAQDARRIFTTASALHALALCSSDRLPSTPRRPVQPAPIQQARPSLEALLYWAAVSAGFPEQQAQEAQALFRRLTRASLPAPARWPSRQLTALSGGMPLEFSCTVGHQCSPALRYATEVADPYLPPPARARSGLRVLRNVAEHLGYQDAWQRLLPAMTLMTDPLEHAPDGTRFALWGGIDQTARLPGQPTPPAGLKVYLNTLHRELGQGRARLSAALRTAAIPVSTLLEESLDVLDTAGFPQELAFALGADGRIACKVYYELSAWQRPLIEQLLALNGFPGSDGQLTPEIPGLIREGLAAKSRAGVGLRLEPSSGEVTELMTACAFPLPLLPLKTTGERVERWLESQNVDTGPYLALARVLQASWPDQTAETRALHSLFTRTLTRQAARTTLYLRPYLGPHEVQA